MFRVSLLHATYRRASDPASLKRTWLARADRADLVEHIFAMDNDDQESLAWTTGHLRTVGEPSRGWVTSVRNWNAAASIATGEVLFVIADDLSPPWGWDTVLRTIVGEIEPNDVAFAIKVQDGPSYNDSLIRHPVVSRAFYKRHGLFSQKFNGLHCDNDITLRAFWREVILDGRILVLEHSHPHDLVVPYSVSQVLVNRSEERAYGKKTFEDSWPRWRRRIKVQMVPYRAGHSPTNTYLLISRLRFRTTETIGSQLRLARNIVRRLSRFGGVD